MSQNSIPMIPTDSQDNEAAGLLMLFSNQSKRLTSNPVSESIPNSTQSVPVIVSPPTVPINTQISNKPVDQNIQMTRRNSSIQRDHQLQNNSSLLDSMTKSPGPAAAALASENGSNKAIVAAAALAAAAATPIPIIHKSLPENGFKIKKEKEEEKEKEKGKEFTANNVLKPGISLKSDNNQRDEKRGRREERSSSQNTNNKRKHKESIVEPTIPSYAVGPDSGIISCICGYDHDDGLTIQCDKCFRWQHLVCMGFKSIDDTPDDFQCNLCNKNLHVDEQKAKKLQLKFLNDEKSKKKRDSNENVKDNTKNNGIIQFKRKKTDDNSNEIIGVNKYKSLYYPIDYYVFKSSSIKSLINQLPIILKKNNDKLIPIVKVDKFGLNKLPINNNYLNIKGPTENAKAKFCGISKLGLFSTKTIKENSCISLMTGEIDTKPNYIMDKVNKYWILGCPKPSVYFHPNLPIVIDQRGLGNFTRFIRKSCQPNCEIKTIISNKNEISFGIFTTKEIKSEIELTLPWEWDDNHPILKLINEDEENFENMNDFNNDDKITIINSILSILDLTECACSNSSSTCIVNKTKKYSTYLQRNSRKSNFSIISPTPNQKHIPIEQRFIERDNYILNYIKNSKNENDDGNGNVSDVNEVEINGEETKEERAQSNNNNKDEIVIDDENDGDDSNKFVFKAKKKSSLYNLHILPKQLELLKKYNEINDNNNNIKVNLTNIIIDKQNGVSSGSEEIINLPIPVEVNPEVLKKIPQKTPTEMNTSIENKNSETENKKSVEGIEEKPKIVKRFSLADYKKKKTG